MNKFLRSLFWISPLLVVVATMAALAGCNTVVRIDSSASNASLELEGNEKNEFGPGPGGFEFRPVPEDKFSVCLSGGGYRATLFHLGVMWALNDAGLLSEVDRLSGVSGGAITAAVVGANWDNLKWAPDRSATTNFREQIADPILMLTSRTVDVPSVLKGLALPNRAPDYVASAYAKTLFGTKTLGDLPDPESGPLVVLLATESRTAMAWALSKPAILTNYPTDIRISGLREFAVINPNMPLSYAVAASSGFPPFLAPTDVKIAESAVIAIPVRNYDVGEPNLDLSAQVIVTKCVTDACGDVPYNDIEVKTAQGFVSDKAQIADLFEGLQLIDGGVFSNTFYENCDSSRNFIVSSATPKANAFPQTKNWFSGIAQATSLIHSRSEALQKNDYRSRVTDECGQDGCRIAVNLYDPVSIGRYGFDFEEDWNRNLAQIDTRLKGLPSALQKSIVNWGYMSIERQLTADATRTRAPFPEEHKPYCLPGIGQRSAGDALDWHLGLNLSDEQLNLVRNGKVGTTRGDGSCEGDWGVDDCRNPGCLYYATVDHCLIKSGPHKAKLGMMSKLGGCLTYDGDVVQCRTRHLDGESCQRIRRLPCSTEKLKGIDHTDGTAFGLFCATDDGLQDCDWTEDGDEVSCGYGLRGLQQPAMVQAPE